MKTLQEAREHLYSNLEDGLHCPCCGQYAKRYKRNINSQMAQWLIWLVQQSRDDAWVDVKEADLRGGDYAKLQHWNLVERRVNEDPEKRTSGLWRPTPKGVQFAKGEISLPQYVLLYNNEVLGHTGNLIGIRAALGTKFDYDELMQQTQE
jgi:hypothetical protein